MKLFSPLRLREIELKNRIVMSPMCEYSAKEGHPQAWHLVHLGSRAIGGAGLVFTEATAVEARGRISAVDTGIYDDAHVESWRPIAEFIRAHGAVPGMQLAHAGRKASVEAPWMGGKPVAPKDGGWEPVGPSALAFDADYSVPRELSVSEIGEIVGAFRRAAERALAAGFEVLEIHAAHGYLIHQFLSPLCNARNDEYGGKIREPNSLCETGCERGARSLATAAAGFCACVGDGLEGRWLGFGADDRAGSRIEAAGRGFDRRFEWWSGARGENPVRSGVSNRICRSDSQGGGDCDGRGGNDHRAGASRDDFGDRAGGLGFSCARIVARSLLAAASGEGTGCENRGA